jgi:hypothetical protein
VPGCRCMGWGQSKVPGTAYFDPRNFKDLGSESLSCTLHERGHRNGCFAMAQNTCPEKESAYDASTLDDGFGPGFLRPNGAGTELRAV